MKKKLTLLLAMGLSLAMNAQSVLSVSPSDLDGEEISFVGEAMSHNHLYAVGTNMEGMTPMFWNTQTGSMYQISFLDSAMSEGEWCTQPITGVLHGVNNNGIAVGSITYANFVSKPIITFITSAAKDGTFTLLAYDEADAGAEAYGITDDGSTILGFHFDAAWITHACIWTNNGQTRTDLALPTEEQLGFPFDYVSARKISADGNTILGYAQDANTGEWVAIAWRKAGDTYHPVVFSTNYFQPMNWEDPTTPENPLPYVRFEPVSLSQDGNWASLKVIEYYDPNDWSITPVEKGARYNFTTGELQVYAGAESYEAMDLFGIANDGTCVGRMAAGRGDETAILWRANESSLTEISTLYADDANLTGAMITSGTAISGDASHILVCALNANYMNFSFVASLTNGGTTEGISDVTPNTVEPRFKGTYDIMGRKVNNITRHGIYFIDGKKVVR